MSTMTSPQCKDEGPEEWRCAYRRTQPRFHFLTAEGSPFSLFVVIETIEEPIVYHWASCVYEDPFCIHVGDALVLWTHLRLEFSVIPFP